MSVTKMEVGNEIHDFDIVEDPVANDDVAKRIDDYLDGTVSKSDFLVELKFRFPTHQKGYAPAGNSTFLPLYLYPHNLMPTSNPPEWGLCY